MRARFLSIFGTIPSQQRVKFSSPATYLLQQQRVHASGVAQHSQIKVLPRNFTFNTRWIDTLETLTKSNTGTWLDKSPIILCFPISLERISHEAVSYLKEIKNEFNIPTFVVTTSATEERELINKLNLTATFISDPQLQLAQHFSLLRSGLIILKPCGELSEIFSSDSLEQQAKSAFESLKQQVNNFKLEASRPGF